MDTDPLRKTRRYLQLTTAEWTYPLLRSPLFFIRFFHSRNSNLRPAIFGPMCYLWRYLSSCHYMCGFPLSSRFSLVSVSLGQCAVANFNARRAVCLALYALIISRTLAILLSFLLSVILTYCILAYNFFALLHNSLPTTNALIHLYSYVRLSTHIPLFFLVVFATHTFVSTLS